MPDTYRYISEGLVSSVSPRIFPGGHAGGASPVRSPQPVRKLLTPLPAHLHPKSRRLSTSESATSPRCPSIPTLPLGHITPRFTARLRLTGIAASALGAVTRFSMPPRTGRQAAGSRGALAGPLLWRDDCNGPSGRRSLPDYRSLPLGLSRLCLTPLDMMGLGRTPSIRCTSKSASSALHITI